MTTRQISNVTNVISGISIIGLIVDTLILKPKYPFWRVSSTIKWNKYIGRVFGLISLSTLLPWVNRFSTFWLGIDAKIRNKEIQAIITLKLDASRKN
jgi:hypothetical protein